jgi:glycogen synthase
MMLSVACRPRVSIVVNSNGRRESLRSTIESFRWLTYDNFEVCVVCGPTRDGSLELMSEYARSNQIKLGTCDELNLSKSRNIGIRLASGDIVAFIDDDAVPEPEWLCQIVPAFEDGSVGGAGGVTYDHTGYDFQARFILCDRFGDAQLFSEDPGISEYNFPFSRRFPSLMGTNSAFRRESLVAIGGFDEEFEYYLDETDVCSRIIDSGRGIVELPNAAVHHKFLPSHLRNEHRFLSTPFPVLKNKIYFAVSQSPTHHRVDEAIRNINRFFDIRRRDILWGIDNQRISKDAIDHFEEQAERAWQVGMTRGFEQRRLTRPREWFAEEHPFQPFPTLRAAGGRRTFVFLSQAYPPRPMAGNARHTHAIAEAIAARGHTVHVLTKGEDFNRVDLERGVWVHRIRPTRTPCALLPDGQAVPGHIWDYSATMLKETLRIARSRRIDAIEGVSWDCETAAFILDGRFPVATNLVTSLAHWLESHPQHAADARWMSDFGRPMLALERLVYEQSDCNIAASDAIVSSISDRYADVLSLRNVAKCPHGLADMAAMAATPPGALEPDVSRTVILFVGRLELRKGIDTLLSAAAQILPGRDDLTFWIAGDNTLDISSGVTAQADFLATHAGARWLDRVRFLGPLEDSELRWLYQRCDMFVAPSRFESFGLVYVEAMIYGKPVIGCHAGGIAEVVTDGGTGLLAPAGDADSLARAILRLADDVPLRAQLGAAGRSDYLARFAADRVAERRIEILGSIARRPIEDHRLTHRGETNRLSLEGGDGGWLLRPEASVAFRASGRRVFLSFCCDERGGSVDIQVDGVAQSAQALVSSTPRVRTVSLELAEPNSEVMIVARGQEVIISMLAER